MNKKGIHQCVKLQDLGECDCFRGKTKSNHTSLALHKIILRKFYQYKNVRISVSFCI